MKKSLILKCLILSLICISCKQKSNKEQKEVNTDKVLHTSESKKTNEVDKKKVDEIKKENSTIENYICYTNNSNKLQKIWIGLNSSNKAMKIRYKGHSESISLKFVRNQYIKGGTQPTIIDYYDEIYKGKKNGGYKLTKSGNWYYVSYKRRKDNKEFNFTIDHTANNFTSIPCF